MTRGAVIFDCDGVLVDSETIANEVCAAAMTEAGFAITPQECRRRYLGMTMRALIQDAEASWSRRFPPGWQEDYNRRVHARLEAEVTAIPGVADAVDAVVAAGWPVAVASSSGHAKIALNLGRTGLADRFAGRIFSGQDVPHGKPAPDVYLLAARTLGVAPGLCSAIEDSPNGVRAAVAAGMRVFGYAAETDPAELAGLGAVVFRDMAELPTLIGSPPAAGM